MEDAKREKLVKWSANATKGERGYSKIVQDREGWHYIEEEIIEPLSSFTIIIQQRGHFKSFYEWDKKNQDGSSRGFIIVTKNDKKLILQDETEGLITFGLSESDDAVEQVLILFSTENVNSIIAASKDAPRIDVRHYYQDEQIDIVQECLRQLIHQIAQLAPTESEVKRYALSDDQFGNESVAGQE